MTAKNVVPKTWPIQASFDGIKYSPYPAGDKPAGYQTTPTILATDIVAGSNMGGENNKGAYVSIFGYGFGHFKNLGKATGAKVYIGSGGTWVEVDNYRALTKSKVFPRLQIQQIMVQVGALAGLTAGVQYYFKVTVNGVDSNTDQPFMIQPGDFYFVSLTGNDSTGVVNDITHPFRYLQYAVNGVSGPLTGVWGPGNVQAGDTIVLRGGTWTDQTGFDSPQRWLRDPQKWGSGENIFSKPRGFRGTYKQAITNCVASGNNARLTVASTAGLSNNDWVTVAGLGYQGGGQYEVNGTWQVNVVNSTTLDLLGCKVDNSFVANNIQIVTNRNGYLHITAYPGPIQGNAPEVPHFVPGSGLGGGIQGPNADQGYNGWGKYYSISNLWIEGPASIGQTASDSGPINCQGSGTWWRIINNELGPWPDSTTNGGTAAAIATPGENGIILFNYIHDIDCQGPNNPFSPLGPGNSTGTALQNHGMYIGGINAGYNAMVRLAPKNTTIAYNWVENMYGGQAISLHNSSWRQSDQIQITGFSNNGGIVRVAVSTATDADLGTHIPSQAYCRIYGVTGNGTALNGNWYVWYVDSTHFDLVGSTWDASYTTATVTNAKFQDARHLYFNNSIYNNYLNRGAKYGLNIGWSNVTGKFYNNIITNFHVAGLRLAITEGSASPRPIPYANILFSHNTLYNSSRYNNSGNSGSILQTDSPAVGSTIKIQHNIIAAGPTAHDSTWVNDADLNQDSFYAQVYGDNGYTTWDRNVWYSYSGLLTTSNVPSGDSNKIWGDPLFTSIPNSNFTLQTSSPAKDAATSTEIITIGADIFGIARPQGAQPDIGATEGVGT